MMEILSEDLDHYGAALAIFMEKYSKLEKDVEWIEKVFTEAVVDQFRSANDKLRSLGIGSGRGELELMIFRFLSNRFSRIDHVVVEPGHELITHYQSATSLEGALPAGTEIKFEWREEKLERYMQQEGGEAGPRQYDVITAVHSLYYVEDMTEAVRFLYDSLAPGGFLVILLQLQEEIPMLGKLWPTASDAKSTLTALDIQYTSFVQSIALDVASIHDATSVEGNLLLDFLTHVKDFRKTASTDRLQQTLLTIKMRSSGDPGDNGTEREGLAENRFWETFIIKKR